MFSRWRAKLHLPKFLHRSSPVARFGVAALLILAAALVCWKIDPLGDQESPFLIFTPAVLIAALFGGRWAGIVATLLGAVIGDYFWVEPLYTFIGTHPHELFHTAVFISVGIAISLISGALETARARAVAANAAKDHFLAVLSHELRNPLAPVIMAVDSLDQTPRLPPSARHDLQTIRRNVALQGRLIDDLLDANRLSHGKLRLEWDTCDAHHVIRDAIEVCNPEASAKCVTITFNPAAQHPHVSADPARLQQIVWNLVRNAVKFTPANGKVTISTRNTEPQSLIIEVTDTGAGIRPTDLARIFEPFEQASNAPLLSTAGLGLGLALTRSLVQLHNGTIDATSPGIGQGATFTVQLPTTPAPTTQDEFPTAPEAPAQLPHHDRRNILLVEDDPDAGPLLRRLLQNIGHQVTLAPTVANALLQSQGNHFDLLIADLHLPDGTGHQLLQQLRQISEIPAICLTGHGTDADLQTSKSAGFDAHLLKPVNLQSLREAIKSLTPAPDLSPTHAGAQRRE